MIVKNEARVLERCLASARPLLDAAVICDTGSADDTVEVARRFGERHALLVDVVREPWVDFGTNRTRALHAALERIERWGWDTRSTWLLLLDADQVLEARATPDPAAWTADAYLLAQQSGDERYWNLRLVRADRRLRYVGATHEYLALPPDARCERLETWLVVDGNDGGARDDKFERDRRLLTAALERDPGDTRALFYLARTYRALGERLKALSLFRRRVAEGGWIEEVWHSWFAVAQLLHEAGEPRAARAALLEARRTDPARAEALELLARVHRETGDRTRAAAVARRGLALAVPADRSLFVDRRTYAHGLRAELARAAAGTRHAEQGFEHLDDLLLERGLPGDLKAELEPALEGYAAAWPAAELLRLAPRLDEPWVACNPCVIPDGDGYLVNCRAVNFRQRDGRDYTPAPDDPVLRSRNVLLELDGRLAPRRECEVHGEPPPPRTTWVRGFEDLRLLTTRDGLLAVAVTTDRHPSGHIGLSVLRLARDGRVLSHAPLTGYGHERAEKNWLPHDGPHGAPQLLYALDPLVRLALDARDGTCRVVERRVLPFDLSRWRGSAGPLRIELDGEPGELVLTHEVHYIPPGRRRYLHRFVWLPTRGEGLAASRPFWWRAPGIEFAAGMCRAHDGDDLLVSFGSEDREAWLARIPLAAVRERLIPRHAPVKPT
jgi:tetratricopeptide (TPR) repeat protein